MQKGEIHLNKHFSVFLTALALAAVLTACGSGGQGTDTGGAADPPQQEEPAPVVPGRDDNTVTPPDTTPGQNPAATDEPGGSVGQDMEDMVKNARVHDRDGDLLDGENHMSSGADRW